MSRIRTTRCFSRSLARSGIFLAILLTIGGCAGSNTVQSDNGSYVSQFARGDYAAAKSTALTAAQQSSGTQKDRANLIAGLSAAQLGQNAEASQLLSPLSTHSDREIAGRATAGMGVIARNQGERAKGASLMAEGARKLSGDPAAKAFMAAGDAYAEIGAKEQAMNQYNAGAAVVQGADLRAALHERLRGKRYAVQVGAFGSRPNADKKAGEIRSKVVSLGLGAPKIEQGVSKGKTTYLVQVGNFASKTEARAASLKMGGGAVVVETNFD